MIFAELTVWRLIDGRRVWRSGASDHLYVWDELHGEVAVFSWCGFHLGAIDPVTRKAVTGPKKGRRLDVR